MPHHKSCKKRLLTAKKATVRNRQIKSTINTAIKRITNADSKEVYENAMKKAYSILDGAAKKGIIHKNKAANQKSRLHKLANKIPTSA